MKLKPLFLALAALLTACSNSPEPSYLFSLPGCQTASQALVEGGMVYVEGWDTVSCSQGVCELSVTKECTIFDGDICVSPGDTFVELATFAYSVRDGVLRYHMYSVSNRTLCRGEGV